MAPGVEASRKQDWPGRAGSRNRKLGRGMETGQGIATNHTFTMRLFHFLAELGRRRVWRTALTYGAVVFVLLQLGEIVFPVFGAPDWAMRLLVVSCFLGFPIALCLAWVFDITPGGIRKTLGVTHVGGGPFGSGKVLPRVTLLALTFATVGGLGWWTLQDAVGANLQAASSGETGPILAAAGTAEGPAPIRSLAVLPLDDFSEEEGGEYFTAGLHEEIVSQLSQAGTTRVLSRTSVVQYDRSGKTMPVIASDLGVEAVVEGSVFRSGDRVRITVQLIHGPTDTHLWANSYEGTLEDAITLQREVAQAIAAEIGAELPGGKVEPGAPTRVARASPVPEEYRKGRHDEVMGTPEALASAMQHYEKTLEEDSSFTPARVGLAQVRLKMDARPDSPGEIANPEHRIVGARRLAASSHYREAEGILRELTVGVDDETSQEAWRILEQIRAVQGDFQGAVGLRVERLSRGLSDSQDSISLFALQSLVQEKGEEGYWAWKVSDLEQRERDGVEVSPVELARTRVGVGDLEGSFPYLETAIVEGDEQLVTLWTDPAWDVLRSDPRFKEILLRVRRSGSRGGFPLP